MKTLETIDLQIPLGGPLRDPLATAATLVHRLAPEHGPSSMNAASAALLAQMLASYQQLANQQMTDSGIVRITCTTGTKAHANG